MIITVAFVGVGLSSFATGLWFALRRPHDIRRAYLALVLVPLGVAFITLANGVQQLESRVLPGVGRYVSNVAMMVAALGMVLFVSAINRNGGPSAASVRWRAAACGVAITVLSVTFFPNASLYGSIGQFGGLYAEHPALVWYVLVYTCYLGLAIGDVGLLAARAVPRAEAGLRVTMVSLVTGSVIALAYLVEKVVHVLGEARDGASTSGACSGLFSSAHCSFSVGAPLLASVIVLFGVLAPAGVKQVGNARQWLGARRAHRLMYPLWSALVTAMPEIMLVPDEPDGDRSRPSMRFRLYRRIIEIRDGMLILSPTLVQGSGEDGQDPAAEAAVIVEMLLSRKTHGPDHPGPARADHILASSARSASDVESETRWLSRLSTEFEKLYP